MRRALAVLAGTALAAAPAALAAPRPPATRPAFTSYAAPAGVADDAGEPTLGFDARSGAVLFQAGARTFRVTSFDGRGGATWRDVSPLLPGLYTFDPILELDPATGRIWSSQLDLYCSRMAFSEDAGASWTQVPLGCGVGAAFDHQTVGVGPFREQSGLSATATYPNAVYYCAQTVVTAQCSVSVDGGLTFLPAVPAYAVDECTGLFGHLKAAPDGTAYLPPMHCGGRAGVAASGDNGLTWDVRRVPGSTVGDAMHPSVHAGADGTLYLGWGGKDGTGPGGPPYAAVSRDRGATWTKPVRLGREHGIRNTRFVTTVAGDGDRAAVAYLGSAAAGNGSGTAFAGAWHLYVSFTWDRGRTWTTVAATPGAPVQHGPICSQGTTCGANRNLLDFIDSVVDDRGRVLVAIADGCPGPVCSTGIRSARATIVRQTAGRGLLRRFDPR